MTMSVGLFLATAGAATSAGDIPPAFLHGRFFLTLGVLALAGVLWGLHALWTRQTSDRVQDRLRDRLARRERVARDLHDTLLQDVQGLTLRLQSVVEQIPADLPARQALESALDRADDVIVEGRDRVKDLRAGPPGDAHEILAELVARLGLASVVKTRMVVEGSPRPLRAPVREAIEQIAAEALFNTRRHARARKLEIDVSYGRRALGLRLRDDGAGLDRAVLGDARREGRRGLAGMGERARGIRSALRIRSRPGAGTEIELTVPGAVAYLEDGGRVWPFGPRPALTRES